LHLSLPLAVALGGLCFIAVYLLEYVYFEVLPRFAHQRYRSTNPEPLRRFLEWVVATPSLFGPTRKLFARDSLAGIYLERGQHAEAVNQFRANLKSLSGLQQSAELFPSPGAYYRVRLADCLEALGRVDEAAEERRRAEGGVDRAEPDALRHRTRAMLLENQNRYEEAYAECQEELDLTPASETFARIECMIHLVLTAYSAGRPADSLRWAEEAIALGAKGSHLQSAHKLAGMACGNLGRLEESEQHYRRAYDAAAAENNRPVMAKILGLLASCLRKRGQLAEADEAAARAAAVDPKAGRSSLLARAGILHARGRYDEALAMLGRCSEADPLAIPDFERRSRAVCSLSAARIEAECGRADDARRHIHEALAVLANDAKLGLICEAALSWAHAVRGDAAESQRLAASLEPRLAAFERDPTTCRDVLYDLGMAACARGDHAAGIDCWTRYLGLGPYPVYQPDALYHRGECHRHLGHLHEARSDYQAAVALDIGTHFSHLALRRLGELALS
jgi:tetratricopeptide (TPR) repeat protein